MWIYFVICLHDGKLNDFYKFKEKLFIWYMFLFRQKYFIVFSFESNLIGFIH